MLHREHVWAVAPAIFTPKNAPERKVSGSNGSVQLFCTHGNRFCRWFCQVIKVVEVSRVLTWRFYFARILPVGFFMALTLHFGNIVYLYLTVSFIQMLKAGPLSAVYPLLYQCPTRQIENGSFSSLQTAYSCWSQLVQIQIVTVCWQSKKWRCKKWHASEQM